MIEHDQHLALLDPLPHHIPHHDHARPIALHGPDNHTSPPRLAGIRADDDLGARALDPPMQLRVLVRHEADDQRAPDVDDLRRAGIIVGTRGRVDALTTPPRAAVVARADAVDDEEAVLLGLEDGDEVLALDGRDAEHAVAREPVLARDDGRRGPGAAAVGRGPHQAVLVRGRILARVVELQRLPVLRVAEEGLPVAVHASRVRGGSAELAPGGAVVVRVGDADAELEVLARRRLDVVAVSDEDPAAGQLEGVSA